MQPPDDIKTKPCSVSQVTIRSVGTRFGDGVFPDSVSKARRALAFGNSACCRQEGPRECQIAPAGHSPLLLCVAALIVILPGNRFRTSCDLIFLDADLQARPTGIMIQWFIVESRGCNSFARFLVGMGALARHVHWYFAVIRSRRGGFS